MNFQKERMKAVCKEKPGGAAKEVGKPIEGIVAGSSGSERLVVFVKSADDAKDSEGNDAPDKGSRWRISSESNPGSKDKPASEEITEVEDLVDVWDLRTTFRHGF